MKERRTALEIARRLRDIDSELARGLPLSDVSRERHPDDDPRPLAGAIRSRPESRRPSVMWSDGISRDR